jgi:hypothetical protein
VAPGGKDRTCPLCLEPLEPGERLIKVDGHKMCPLCAEAEDERQAEFENDFQDDLAAMVFGEGEDADEQEA